MLRRVLALSFLAVCASAIFPFSPPRPPPLSHPAAPVAPLASAFFDSLERGDCEVSFSSLFLPGVLMAQKSAIDAAAPASLANAQAPRAAATPGDFCRAVSGPSVRLVKQMAFPAPLPGEPFQLLLSAVLASSAGPIERAMADAAGPLFDVTIMLTLVSPAPPVLAGSITAAEVVYTPLKSNPKPEPQRPPALEENRPIVPSKGSALIPPPAPTPPAPREVDDHPVSAAPPSPALAHAEFLLSTLLNKAPEAQAAKPAGSLANIAAGPLTADTCRFALAGGGLSDAFTVALPARAEEAVKAPQPVCSEDVLAWARNFRLVPGTLRESQLEGGRWAVFWVVEGPSLLDMVTGAVGATMPSHEAAEDVEVATGRLRRLWWCDHEPANGGGGGPPKEGPPGGGGRVRAGHRTMAGVLDAVPCVANAVGGWGGQGAGGQGGGEDGSGCGALVRLVVLPEDVMGEEKERKERKPTTLLTYFLVSIAAIIAIAVVVRLGRAHMLKRQEQRHHLQPVAHRDGVVDLESSPFSLQGRHMRAQGGGLACSDGGQELFEK